MDIDDVLNLGLLQSEGKASATFGAGAEALSSICCLAIFVFIDLSRVHVCRVRLRLSRY